MSQVIGNGSQLTINSPLRSLTLVARVRPGASHACILGANSGNRYLSVLKMSASAFQLPPCCFFQTTAYFPGMVMGAPCASFRAGARAFDLAGITNAVGAPFLQHRRPPLGQAQGRLLQKTQRRGTPQWEWCTQRFLKVVHPPMRFSSMCRWRFASSVTSAATSSCPRTSNAGWPLSSTPQAFDEGFAKITVVRVKKKEA